MPLDRTVTFGVAFVLALATAAGGQEVGMAPGPIEKRANPITPENPIPRRTFSLAPAYPAEADAIQASAVVRMRVTLDEAGRIAEIRRVSNPLVSDGSAAQNPAGVRAAGEAMVRSAAAALWQWQYDAPARGPVSFDVNFVFRPGVEVTSAQAAGGAVGTAGAATVFRPATPTPEWEAARGALRVGGAVRPPVQVRRVNPLYPAEARAAGVQGVVILEALIGPDGTVRDARILRSIPLLDEAALDAVRQWQYEPTLLNGAPAPVVLTVTVQFTLSQPPPPAQ